MNNLRSSKLAYLAARQLAQFRALLPDLLARRVRSAQQAPRVQQDLLAQLALLVSPALPAQQEISAQPAQPDPQATLARLAQQDLPVRRAMSGLLVQQALLGTSALTVLLAHKAIQAQLALRGLQVLHLLLQGQRVQRDQQARQVQRVLPLRLLVLQVLQEILALLAQPALLARQAQHQTWLAPQAQQARREHPQTCSFILPTQVRRVAIPVMATSFGTMQRRLARHLSASAI